MRRLAPHCARIELADLPSSRDEERLLYAMGFETANVHLGTPRIRETLRKQIAARRGHWLHETAKQMAGEVVRDWVPSAPAPTDRVPPVGAYPPRTSIRTVTTPSLIIPSLRAAPSERSTMRPPGQPQRSLIRTVTERPLARLTRTRVPNGSDGEAAVMAFGSKRSPEAVLRPAKPRP